MHNWSLGNVLHVIDAIVWEQSTFLQSFTVHRAAQGGAAQETQVIPDAAIVRLYTITMKATLESYTNDTTHIRLTDRARRRMGRVAETLLQKKKKPSNLRADEADALLQALPTALENLLSKFVPELQKHGYSKPLVDDPTPKIIGAVTKMLSVRNIILKRTTKSACGGRFRGRCAGGRTERTGYSRRS